MTKARWRALLNIAASIRADIANAAEYLGEPHRQEQLPPGTELSEREREAVEREMEAIADAMVRRAHGSVLGVRGKKSRSKREVDSS